MKVKIRSVLKTSQHDFQCFDDQQVIFPAGNTLCIKEIGKNQAQFICLNKGVQHLYSFKPSTHKKGVFTAEKLENSIQIAYYNLKGQRKAVNLTYQSSFFTDVQKIELLVDEYDNSLVYGAARNKQASCVFLCDLSKSKVIAHGFMPHFEDIKVDSRQNMTLSLCGFNGSYNYIKYLRYGLGQWQIQEYPYKKISQHHQTVIYHQLLFGGRILLATRLALYIFEDTDLLQTMEIPLNNKIRSILRIPKAFLVLLQSQKIMLFIEDSDEVTFLEKGEIYIELDQYDSIHKMQLSFNNEEVVIRTVKNSLYTWKSQHIGLDAGHSEMTFVKLESSCVGDKTGSITISTGKRYCMLSGTKNVTLWSLEKNQYVLSSDFISNQNKRKNIITSAVSPDGNSFILSFEDKIKIYKILLTKFKPYAQFTIKRCQNIIYSHGGQLVACRYGKGVNSCVQVINLLRLASISIIKVQAEPTQILWNELDDQIVVAAQNYTIQIFKISENIRIYNIKFETPIFHVRIDYKVRKLLVSTQNKISVIDGGDIIDEIIPPMDKFHYVFPLYGIYFIVSKSGTLYWSSSLKFQNFGEYSLFPQKTFNLICRNSYLVAYASFQDVVVLECIRHDHIKRANDNDIVMVERDEILTVFDKLKILESNFDMLQTATQVKLQEQKNNYEAAVDKLKSKFNHQITFLNSKFSDLSISKLKQERQTQKIFQEIDTKQITNVNELQKMFSRKLVIQKEKYMNLEQSALQQKLKYQKIIYDLQARYHRQVGQIREQYSKKMKEEYLRAEDIKKHNLQDKERLQIKLLDLQEQNQFAMTNIQQDKDIIINQLNEKIKNLQGQYDTLLIKYHNQQEKLNRIESQKERREFDFRKLNATLEENMNRIRLLQEDVVSKNAMVEQKNQIIKELGVQIGGLEKAKYVLSFRTTQIRKQLQPKEALIDNLKSELFKLDDQFKQQKKRVFQLKQKIEKLQTINQFTKKQNVQSKALLKQKQRIHDQLCFDIFMIINTIDQKEWNNSFIKVYQSYIKQDKFKNRQTRKKDNTSQQINRHLIHVQQSLHQISSGNNKSLKRKQQQITKKMQENSLLIYQLNVMRKNEKYYENDKKQMSVAFDRMKRELNESYKSSNAISTRAHTAKSGITKRITASRDAMSREKSTILDINELNNSKDSKSKQQKSRNKSRSRVSSANKTLMMRQNDREQLNKFFQVAKDLQSCRNTIKIQDEMIEQLNQRLFGGQQRQK